MIPFHRSVFDLLTGTTSPREQINEITSFIDGSNVYGSTPERASWLRTHVHGRLKVTPGPRGDLLPYNDGTQPNAGSPEVPDLSTTLFVAGDIRANEQPTLAIMHTLFVREHNYQAAQIEGANPCMFGRGDLPARPAHRHRRDPGHHVQRVPPGVARRGRARRLQRLRPDLEPRRGHRVLHRGLPPRPRAAEPLHPAPSRRTAPRSRKGRCRCATLSSSPRRRSSPTRASSRCSAASPPSERRSLTPR